MTKITTIKLQKETKTRIEKLREHKRESYDEIIRKILWILNIIKIDTERAREILDKIDENRKRLFKKSSKPSPLKKNHQQGQGFHL
jgi:hypothetical protein